MFKHQGTLFLLVTDQGYLRESQVSGRCMNHIIWTI